MTLRIVRFTMLSVAAGLALAAMTACFFGGGEEPTSEPTPDLQATIAAALTDSIPTATPMPEPTPEPTPNLPATLAAMAAAAAAAAPPTPVPTAVPEPTPDVQATVDAYLAATAAATPPTATPEPTATPAPAPTNAPTPAPTTAPLPSGGPPCVITGTVTIGGETAPENTVVLARSKDPGQAGNVQAQTDEDGRYVLTILNYGVVFDLIVDNVDTNKDTPQTSRGCRVAIPLSR